MESFEQVAAQYEPMIHRIMNDLSIYKNRDEFYQLGLISLWQGWENYNSEKGNFISYAFGYVKGKMQNELTRQSAYLERYVYPDEEFWEVIEDHLHESPSTFLHDLLSICGTLTANQKKWLIYTLENHLTVQEIAVQEHVSLSAVKAWRQGARDKLKVFNFKGGRLEDLLF
ncbi:sigma-70 family RNA polymerase sigma factor [Bacillus sp. ISL-47]|uniref:sigma-70 family RNA polymerase sigma factor n=1 Tax=Bacillus sp. ISL-47 TaxID=2819130 RepID=UPI001BE7245F|nr:sigma-70 family RNA polymerase sigma factor [Bacillus sp. ISL-47]MBT2686611.1 sigma-70 family RNA polymerase sigma factor [Bacillus sp. ISL-47]MBT2707003.1 sigma-70 family RNA polymerase sigma factor [Pseudomonas sp. ISL-84]